VSYVNASMARIYRSTPNILNESSYFTKSYFLFLYKLNLFDVHFSTARESLANDFDRTRLFAGKSFSQSISIFFASLSLSSSLRDFIATSKCENE
jgi:hypothetical protein